MTRRRVSVVIYFERVDRTARNNEGDIRLYGIHSVSSAGASLGL
jgi:hypothetical protein